MKHRWLARGLVIGGHAALLALLWLHRGPSFEPKGDRRLTTVRLLLPKAAEEPRTQAPPPPPRPQPGSRQAPPPTPSTPPEEATTAPAPVIAVPAEAAAPAAEPPRTTLRLTLPPGYAASANARRNPALDDPRSNTARSRTLEDRIADATGGAAGWMEEPVENHAQVIGAVGEHRTVLRKGDTCMEVFRSRISDSDPFNRNVAPRTVAMMGKAYTCKNTKSSR